MSDLQRNPNVECMACGSEVRLVGDAILGGVDVNMKPACDCRIWDCTGDVPEPWHEIAKLGENDE